MVVSLNFRLKSKKKDKESYLGVNQFFGTSAPWPLGRPSRKLPLYRAPSPPVRYPCLVGVKVRSDIDTARRRINILILFFFLCAVPRAVACCQVPEPDRGSGFRFEAYPQSDRSSRCTAPRRPLPGTRAWWGFGFEGYPRVRSMSGTRAW